MGVKRTFKIFLVVLGLGIVLCVGIFLMVSPSEDALKNSSSSKWEFLGENDELVWKTSARMRQTENISADVVCECFKNVENAQVQILFYRTDDPESSLRRLPLLLGHDHFGKVNVRRFGSVGEFFCVESTRGALSSGLRVFGLSAQGDIVEFFNSAWHGFYSLMPLIGDDTLEIVGFESYAGMKTMTAFVYQYDGTAFVQTEKFTVAADNYFAEVVQKYQ